MTPKKQCRPYKDQIYRELERVGKALSSQRRLELLELLSQAPRSVEELAEELEVSVASASQHLQRLKQARLVKTERDGNFIFYEVANQEVAELYAAFRRLAEERLPTIGAVVESFLDPETRATEDLQVLMESAARGEIYLVDARPEEEYWRARVEGAHSVPVERYEEHLERLPRDRRIIAYCRGPFCAFADELVKRLRARGFDAWRLELGIADFRERDIAITSGR